MRCVMTQPSERSSQMCFLDCPVCDLAVAFQPGDDEFDCPACGVAPVVDEAPRLVLAKAA